MAIEMNETSVANFLAKTGQYLKRRDYEASIETALECFDDIIHAYARDRAADAADKAACEADHLLGQCDSPIEKMLLMALLTSARDTHYDTIDVWHYSLAHPDDPPSVPVELIIESQAAIDKYRIDFRITRRDYDARQEKCFTSYSVLVECDGHDFHERTKAQAKKDRARDRHLQALGHTILRFTGSEIYEDPYKCAKEIYDFLHRKERGL